MGICGQVWLVVSYLCLHSKHTLFMWTEYFTGSFEKVYGNGIFGTFCALLGGSFCLMFNLVGINLIWETGSGFLA